MASERTRRVVRLQSARALTPLQHCLGRLVDWSERDGPLVDYPGNTEGPLRARLAMELDAKLAKAALESGAEVLLGLDASRPESPILLALVRSYRGSTEAEPAEEACATQPAPLEALVDGKRVVLSAQDEIVLQCGKASITLRRNGRVIVRGAYVETCAEGVHRIKGGVVKIN